jgi:hypothetical protein
MGSVKDYLKKIKAKLRHVYIEYIKFNAKLILRRIGILPSDKFLSSLKDKYKGKKIFVIATGPSLTMEDLELVRKSGCVTISCNGIFKIFDKTEWRPDYYAADDCYVISRYVKDYPDVRLDEVGTKGTVFDETIKGYIPYYKDMKNTGFFSMCYFDHWKNAESKKFKYCRDMQHGCYDFYTVTHTMVNLADYMGASEVYILGADFDFSGPAAHVGEAERKIDKQSNYDATTRCLNRGADALHRLMGDNCAVYNATRGGKLEAFPRITLEEAVKR